MARISKRQARLSWVNEIIERLFELHSVHADEYEPPSILDSLFPSDLTDVPLFPPETEEDPFLDLITILWLQKRDIEGGRYLDDRIMRNPPLKLGRETIFQAHFELGDKRFPAICKFLETRRGALH